MSDKKTFEEREDALIAKALKDDSFRYALPPGMAERLARRVRAVESPGLSGPRWPKVAAAVATIASFAAFAAAVAVRLAVEENAVDTTAAPVASMTEETFEEIFSEELEEMRQQEEKAMNSKTVSGLAAGAIAAAASFVVPSAQGEVRGGVFDDVKVWYKGSAGNAVGTSDSGRTTTKMKSLPQLADSSSAMHGGNYGWWGWRVQYANQSVDCPYAGVTLDAAPCVVIPSYAEKTGDATVTINGEVTSQPYWTARRFGNLYFNNWMSDWTSGTVCSNWTCVLRFRSDQVNQVSGNPNCVIEIGPLWSGTAGAATGVSLNLNTPEPLADYACPRVFVTTTQKNYHDIKIRSGRWVDCALAVDGQTLSMWFCWNNGTDDTPTNKLVKITETYPTSKGLPTIAAGCRVNLASRKDAYSATFTNGVYNVDMGAKAFEGAFHQIAFWDRTLSDNEIREAMVAGTGRPNLVHVGIEGNGTGEFATSSQTARVSNTGTWENLNPVLTEENPAVTIDFSCPVLWAGMAQYLRLPMAGTSSSGSVSIALNGENLGEISVGANRTSLFYIEKGKILSGDNTLTVTRTEGACLVLDAVTLGGSWKCGENVGSFGYQNEATDNPDKYLFSPACGSDKIHHRGMNAGKGNETFFDFYVPADIAGKFRGVFATRAQNTGGSEKNFTLYVNGDPFGGYKLKGGVVTEIGIAGKSIVPGWNRLSWMSHSGGDWANIDWHRFDVLPPVKGTYVVIR